MKKTFTFRVVILSLIVLLIILASSFAITAKAYVMPFYDLRPQEIVLRAEFSTDYSKSSAERKHNISLAAKSLNNVFVDVGGEFSFNKTVGVRTEKRGYKSAKIISNGEFVEGVGGGVCQVSTTLYNAVIRAGLKITEFHAHSLSVSYVAPSMDAMVNSGSADLRFINTTHNPIIVKTSANGTLLTVRIYGEPLKEKYELKSVIKSEIPPEYEVIKDSAGEYPDLLNGERRIIKYGKSGITSEGYLIKTLNGKVLTKTRVRRDRYLAINGTMVEGTALPESSNGNQAT